MNAEMLLDELAGLGIRLVRDRDAILADVEDGADIALHGDRITANKPELLAALALREQIIAAATVDPEDFDRLAYNALWRQWRREGA